MWGKHGKTHIFGMVETGGEPHFPQGFNIWNGYIPIRDYPTNEKKPEDRACLNRSQYFSLSQSSVSKSDVTVTLLPGINYGIMRRFSVFCWILWLLHPRLDKTALYLCENLCRLCLLRCASGCGCQWACSLLLLHAAAVLFLWLFPFYVPQNAITKQFKTVPVRSSREWANQRRKLWCWGPRVICSRTSGNEKI